jgi:hypothetical protein
MDSDAWLTLPDAWLTPIAILSASCFGIICSIFWSGQHFRGEIAHTPPAESKRIIEQILREIVGVPPEHAATALMP